MASIEDARLIIELSRWASEWGFHEANRWVRSHKNEISNYKNFLSKYPVGTIEYKHPFTVLGYFENIGLFYKHGVIDKNLVLDWLDFEEPWTLMSQFALSDRERSKEPTMWQNFENLAREQETWRREQRNGETL